MRSLVGHWCWPAAERGVMQLSPAGRAAIASFVLANSSFNLAAPSDSPAWAVP